MEIIPKLEINNSSAEDIIDPKRQHSKQLRQTH